MKRKKSFIKKLLRRSPLLSIGTPTVVLAIAGLLLIFFAAAGGSGSADASICSGKGVTVSYKHFDGLTPAQIAEQRADAEAVINAALKLGVTYHGEAYGLAIALRESDLINIAVMVDHHSLGIFQQQYDQNWGTQAQILDPNYASTAFFQRMMLNDPAYDALPFPAGLGTIVADVQRPAARTIPQYDNFMGEAIDILASAGIKPNAPQPSIQGCIGNNSNGPTGTKSNGEPIVSDAHRQKILDAVYGALQAKWPYVWDAGDAHGPTKALNGCDAAAVSGCATIGFDCSGLTLYAYAQAGILLGHNTNDQLNDPSGRAVSVSDLQPGDLVFFGSPSNAHHVGVFVHKDGNSYQMIDTPTEGQTVMYHYFYGPKDQEFDFAAARRYV